MADPISSSGANAGDWQGMASDLGRAVRNPAVAAVQTNLTADRTGQVVARDGLVPVRFEEEDINDL